VRNAINAKRIPGPRLLASTPEVTVTGGLGDERLLHIYRESEAVVVDGPDAIRTYVRTMCREGCDIIKLTISGSPLLPNAPAGSTVMTEAEIEAAATTAKRFNKRLASHSHSSEAVQLSIKHGIELIHHCTLIDEQTMDMVVENRDRIFLGPAIGSMHNTMYEASEWGMTPEAVERSGMRLNFESAVRVYRALRKRGVRVVIGGDYGFAWTPHGTQARDLVHFVNYFGYSPEEALVCGTVIGAQAMRMEGRIGQIKPGFLADMIAVDGCPHQNVACLAEADRILMVMKDGEVFGPATVDHSRARSGDVIHLLADNGARTRIPA
jgi:imidazolonepropionase-like amidohydrolase